MVDQIYYHKMWQNYDIGYKCWYTAAEHTWDDFFLFTISVRYVHNGDNDKYLILKWQLFIFQAYPGNRDSYDVQSVSGDEVVLTVSYSESFKLFL